MTHTPKQKQDSFDRIKAVIHSCRTVPHFEAAIEMVATFSDQYSTDDLDPDVIVLEGIYLDQVRQFIPNEQTVAL